MGTTHADHFYGSVPVTRPLTRQEVGEAYEVHTGNVIVERFQDLDPLTMPAVLVAGHAPFTWGRSVAESVENAVALEAVATMALAALQLRGDMPPLEPYVLEKHYQRKHGAARVLRAEVNWRSIVAACNSSLFRFPTASMGSRGS